MEKILTLGKGKSKRQWLLPKKQFEQFEIMFEEFELVERLIKEEVTMKTNDPFIRNEYDEFININRIEELKIKFDEFKANLDEKPWLVAGYTMSSVGSYFSIGYFETKEAAEEFIYSLLTIKED